MRTARILCISLIIAYAVQDRGVAQERAEPASFRLSGIGLRASLDSLMKWYPVSIIYMDKDVEGRTVSAACTGCDFEEALTAVLEGTSLMWVRIGNQVILKPRPLAQPRPAATVAGVVRDSLTGEQIADANVMLQDTSDQEMRTDVRRWCPTNEFGFYSLRQVPPGAYALVIRAVGYRPVRKALLISAAGPVREDVVLAQENIAFQEVTVEGHRSAFSAAAGLSRGVYIRSTPTDQNQYLLDGARIYNPSHYGGVLSTFNADAVNDVQVITGSLPPYYGGRIGGTLDLSLRDGTMRGLTGVAGTGSLGSHVALEGPVAGPVTFLFSARRGFPNSLIPSLGRDAGLSRLGSTELIGKMSYRISGSQRLSLSGYYGRDAYDNVVEGASRRLSNDFSWGNGTVNLRWTGIASPSLFLQASAVYTRYGFTLNHLWEERLPYPWSVLYSSDYRVEDIDVRAYAEHYYDEDHTVRGGVELVNHRMSGAIHAFSDRIAPYSPKGFSGWELSIYLQDQWRLLPTVTAELGGRMTSFSGNSGTFSAVDPRFSLLVTLDEQTRCYTALTSINQFVHPYRNSGVFLLYPAIFWYPSSNRVRPTTALQVTLGAERSWGESIWSISADAFYRITHNLHEFVRDTAGFPEKALDELVVFGRGASYGVELSFGKRLGSLSGSLSYTLSWNRNRFAELNGGAPFTPWFDRRHEVQLSASYAPDDRWLFAALCIVASEQLPRVVSSGVPTESGVDPSRFLAFSNAMIDINGGRSPGFQRLELGTAYRFPIAGLQSQVSVRFMNRYGLLDPFSWQIRTNPNPQDAWTVQMRDLGLFPLYPTLGLSVRF